MAIDYETLKAWKIPSVGQRYTEKDVMLYALGLGLGLNTEDHHHLRFVYEKGLRILPTQATVLAHPGFWLSDPATGIDWKRIVHAAESLEIHSPLPLTGDIVSHARVEEIIDKGPGNGALLYTTRQLVEPAAGRLLCTQTTTIFLRGAGGFGGPRAPAKPRPSPPSGAPHMACDYPTTPQTALIYRLSGDPNPLHADPEVARSAGFAGPILHGLASFGIAGYGIVSQLCDGDTARLRSISVRFSAPIYPGETLRTEMWHAGAGRCIFRCRVIERDSIVLTDGQAAFDANSEHDPASDGRG